MFRPRAIGIACVSALAGILAFMPNVALADLARRVPQPQTVRSSLREITLSLFPTIEANGWCLYSYPKDHTVGCTLAAHNFQRDLSKYEALNAVVLGVSLDTVGSHKSFCTKDSLTFKLLADPDHTTKLLADPDHTAIDAYGVPVRSLDAMHYAERTTFLI